MDEIKIQDFGYSEMYEWLVTPDENRLFARFVTFDKTQPEKIVLFGSNDNEYVTGITTINSLIDSDDPNEWKKRYVVTDIGDIVLKNEQLVVGAKQYDENLEMSFIQTYPWNHYIKIDTEEYDENKKYVKRSNRKEWIRVNLMGKVIVKDDGTCIPGKYCTPYTGKIKDKWGTATLANNNSTMNTYYVLSRIDETTILILNK